MNQKLIKLREEVIEENLIDKTTGKLGDLRDLIDLALTKGAEYGKSEGMNYDHKITGKCCICSDCLPSFKKSLKEELKQERQKVIGEMIAEIEVSMRDDVDGWFKPGHLRKLKEKFKG